MALTTTLLLNLVGPVGPASLVTVTAPPGPTVGVVGGYAVQNKAGVILLYGPKVSTGWPQSAADAQGNTTPTFVQLTGATGLTGSRILQTTGVPSAAVGNDGDYAIDSFAGFLYGPRTGGVWSSTPTLSLVGPPGPRGATGAAAVLPQDYTANSYSVVPVSGSATNSAITQKSSGGATLFSSDTSGNVTVAGTLKASGATTLAAASVTGLTNTGNESVTGTLSVAGATTLAALQANSVISNNTATAKNFTLASGGGGVFTFADGTTQSTAVAASAGSGLLTVDMGMSFPGSGAYQTSYAQNNMWMAQTNATTGVAYGKLFAAEAAGYVVRISGWIHGFTVNPYYFQLYKNNVATGLIVSLTIANGQPSAAFISATNNSPTTYTFAAGDALSIYSYAASGATARATVAQMTFRYTA